jgi:hypothetical protein
VLTRNSGDRARRLRVANPTSGNGEPRRDRPERRPLLWTISQGKKRVPVTRSDVEELHELLWAVCIAGRCAYFWGSDKTFFLEIKHDVERSLRKAPFRLTRLAAADLAHELVVDLTDMPRPFAARSRTRAK